MLLLSILLLVPAAIAVIINQATYNCTQPVVHHEQAGGNLEDVGRQQAMDERARDGRRQ